MAITRKNRKGDVYYLHEGTTKAGRPRYHMSRSSEGTLADALPKGYELWEDPRDAQVHCRKIPKRLVTEEEIALVRDTARKLAQTHYVIVDATTKDIVVYSSGDDERLDSLAQALSMPIPTVRAVLERTMMYDPMFRFSLDNQKDRQFIAYRWCFRGAVDDWICLDAGQLGILAERYLPHLGSETFFDLSFGDSSRGES